MSYYSEGLRIHKEFQGKARAEPHVSNPPLLPFDGDIAYCVHQK